MSATTLRLRKPVRYFGRYWRAGEQVDADTETGRAMLALFPDRVEVVAPKPPVRDYLAEPLEEMFV